MGRRRVGNNLKKNTKKSSTNKSKRNNKSKRFLTRLLFLIILVILLSGVAFAIHYLCTTDNLKVKYIKVEKAEYYTEEQVLEVANIRKNSNMLFIGRKKIKNKILKELPYIETVRIKIGKESTLRIILVERTSKYVVNNKDTNEYVKVDKNGIMLEKVKVEEILQEEIPLFGLSLDKNEKVGKSIPETERRKIERFEQIHEAYLNENIDSKVTSVKFENSKIILTLDYKTELITEVTENLSYKMKFLKEILKEVAGRGGRIDLTLDNPTFVEKIG